MATSAFKNENMISRFTKLPDKCQATVLVSEKIRFTKIPDKCQATIIGKWKNSMHEVNYCQFKIIFSRLDFQFVGSTGIGKRKVAKSMLGLRSDFAFQM